MKINLVVEMFMELLIEEHYEKYVKFQEKFWKDSILFFKGLKLLTSDAKSLVMYDINKI